MVAIQCGEFSDQELNAKLDELYTSNEFAHEAEFLNAQTFPPEVKQKQPNSISKGVDNKMVAIQCGELSDQELNEFLNAQTFPPEVKQKQPNSISKGVDNKMVAIQCGELSDQELNAKLDELYTSDTHS